MNLAIFLHNQKQFKDSVLPLPLAPVYVLPHHKWYFSSASLTPLRKRRQNTSFFKYLEELQMVTQISEENIVGAVSNGSRQILCIYEKNNYFDNKIKHIFDAIYANYMRSPKNSQRIKCDCNAHLDQQSSKHFITKVHMLNKCLSASKKNPKIEVLTQEQQKINWYEFTKNLIFQSLQISCHSIPEESLHLYKLPETPDGRSPFIFNVLWSDNYVIFNNGNKIEINQNMKSKAVELCQQIYKKLDEFIWAKAQFFIPKIAQELSDHETFMQNVKERLRISTFKVWFYKKTENNEIYIINLSHITLKGVQCTFYSHYNIMTATTPNPISALSVIPEDDDKLKDITQLNKSFENKKKAFSVSNKSHKTLRKLVNGSQLQRMKELLDDRMDLSMKKGEEMLVDDCDEVTQIQCSCCKDLLTTSQVVNEITASHIQEIRYLRQIKIGKKQYSPYDFVKVCTLCYAAFLKHYKHNSQERKSDKQSLQREGSIKNSHSFLDKGATSFQDYKSREGSFKFHQNDNRILFGKVRKERARSELNNSKEQIDFNNEDKVMMSKDRSISLRPPLYQPPKPQKKKINTTKTTNTQNTINQREEFQDLNSSKFVIARSQTQEEQPMLSNHNSIRFKNQLQNKTHNLINRIISNSFEAKKVHQPCQENSSRHINTKIIINAIDQYEKIDRVSFKKLITKNHRMFMIQEPSRDKLDKAQNWESDLKKSIKSYFQN